MLPKLPPYSLRRSLLRLSRIPWIVGTYPPPHLWILLILTNHYMHRITARRSAKGLSPPQPPTPHPPSPPRTLPPPLIILDTPHFKPTMHRKAQRRRAEEPAPTDSQSLHLIDCSTHTTRWKILKGIWMRSQIYMQ